MTATVATIRLSDYTPPPFLIHKTDLTFKLDPLKTEVTAVLQLEANPKAAVATRLFLHGQDLTLISVAINGTTNPAAGGGAPSYFANSQLNANTQAVPTLYKNKNDIPRL